MMKGRERGLKVLNLYQEKKKLAPTLGGCSLVKVKKGG